MLLEKLTIENFQAIKEPAEIEFGKLTFLYGPNSAGKSAVFDALELLERMALSDPTFADLVRSGKRQELFDLEKDNPGSDQSITLTAVFYVDELRLSQADSGTAFFINLPKLQEGLCQGARIEMRVQFDRIIEGELQSLLVKIDDDDVLHYSNRETDYDPYYRLDPVRRVSSEDAFLFGHDPLSGEWKINLNHPAAADLRLDLQPRGARARLVLPEHSGGVQIVRGLKCSAPGGAGSLLRLPSDMLAFLFPGDVSDPDGEHWLTGRQGCLEYFELDPPHASAAHYRMFLTEEITAEHSSRLYTQLRDVAHSLNRFVAALFTLLGEAVRLNRVRGDRSSFDSNQPLHLLSEIDSHFAAQPPDPVKGPSGQMLIQQSRQSQLYSGARRWNGNESTLEPDLKRVLAAYAVRMHGAEYRDIFREIDEADFPNYCLGQYLHSLRRYRIIPEEYCVAGPWEEDSQDRSELAGTRLVYFSVLEQSGRRTFAEVGSSLGYLFPILVTLSEERLCGIEQPELHLHPLAQDQLADVFLHAASRGRRAIIESHSEVFLLRLAQRIKETQDRLAHAGDNVVPITDALHALPEDIRMYYFSPAADSGTTVLPIRFAPDGSLLDLWPDGMISKDWTSGLDRMRRLSGELDAVQAAKEWPWIAHVDDPSIRRWLTNCWVAPRMGTGQDETLVLFAGKIVEKLLADALLRPIDSANESPFRLKATEPWERDFDKCWGKQRTPVLDSWSAVLVKLRRDAPGEHPFLSRLRSFLREQSWGAEWLASESDLLRLLGLLQEQRNKAAHTRETQSAIVAQIRPLIEEGGRPGLVFRALGVAVRGGGSGLRVV